MGDKSGAESALFANYSRGVTTARDAWAFNPSRHAASANMARMIDVYNRELRRFVAAFSGLDRPGREAQVDGFVDADPTKISWSGSLKTALTKGVPLTFEQERLVPSLYRPFGKQWLYFASVLNERLSQMPSIFPLHGASNRAILIKQRWRGERHLALLVDVVPEVQADGGSQCFPLYLYHSDSSESEADDDVPAALIESPKKPSGSARRDGITDAGLAHFQSAYPGQTISKEDVFYYVYGILHSADYRERYADNLGKELPRIPRVKTAADFWAFSRAGRALGDLHVGYERAPEYAARIEGPARPTAAQHRVEKMKFGKGKDKTVVHYNDFITVRDIPLEAYEYVVNGKPAIEWVMERQSVTTDKASGIVKDANAWATETVGDARYPLSLLLRVITVSLETMKIVRGLPALDLMEEQAT